MAKSTDAKVDALALEVAIGSTVSEAARLLRVNVFTAQHWAQRPEFWPKVAAHRREIVDRTVGMLANRGVSAVFKLTELLNEGFPPEIQFKAARQLLVSYLDVVSHQELAERLDAIEKRLAAHGAGERQE